MDLLICQGENGFSLDELVFKLADLFDRKAFAELLKLILDLVQEILLYRILNGKIDAMKCCTTGSLLLNGTFKRQFRTNLGEFTMKLWRVKCTSCGKTFSSLQRFLKLKPYQTKTNELEKMVADAVSAETYRRQFLSKRAESPPRPPAFPGANSRWERGRNSSPARSGKQGERIIRLTL